MQLKVPDALKPAVAKPKIQYYHVDVQLNGDEIEGFDGYASTFWAVDTYHSAVAPGAFTETLKTRGAQIPILWQHDPATPIGKPTSLKQDKIGLAFQAAISTDTQAGANAMALVRFGVPLGMSFGFETLDHRAATDEDPLDFSQMPKGKKQNKSIDLITKAKLWEISLVTFPANEAASILAVRAELDRDAESLSTFLNAIRRDALDEGERAFVQQIVDADTERAAAGSTAPDHCTPEQARRDIYGEFCLVMAGLGLPVE
jgi:HK97 family phage prohead protease